MDLNDQRRAVAAVLEASPHAAIACAFDGSVLHANAAARRLLGGTSVDIASVQDVVDPAAADDLADVVQQVGQPAGMRGASTAVRLFAPRHPHDECLRLDLRRIHAPEPAIVVWLNRIGGATHSSVDPLTGLANRQQFARQLDAHLDDGNDPGPAGHQRALGSLAFVDLDHFKGVNDRAGHAMGDRVLRLVGHMLANALPSVTDAFRFGGDEFVCLLRTLDPPATAALMSEIADQLRGRDFCGDGSRLSFSAGIASLEGVSPSLALRRADAALYAAKVGGRAKVVVDGSDVTIWAEDRRQIVRQVERLREEAELWRREATIDPLTGVPNLRALKDALANLDVARRRDDSDYCVLFVDADRFGLLNHVRGDAAGDHALVRVATVLSDACRAGDAAYRKGGEEFVVILRQASREDGVAVAERLRACVEALAIPHGGAPDAAVLTVTIGVASSKDAADARQVMETAGRRAYWGKEHGLRNRVIATEKGP